MGLSLPKNVFHSVITFTYSGNYLSCLWSFSGSRTQTQLNFSLTLVLNIQSSLFSQEIIQLLEDNWEKSYLCQKCVFIIKLQLDIPDPLLSFFSERKSVSKPVNKYVNSHGEVLAYCLPF